MFLLSVFSGLDVCYYCSNIIVSLFSSFVPSFSLRWQEKSKVLTCCPETDSVCLTEKFVINHQIIFLIWIFLQYALYNCISGVCSEFFYLSCRSSPKKLFTACWPVFHWFCHVFFFSVLQTLSLLFLCKNFLEILRNSSPCWKSLFPVEANYFIMGTNHSNQLMMSCVWREFSSMRRKMMKEDSGVSSAQAWGCPHAYLINVQGDSSV